MNFCKDCKHYKTTEERYYTNPTQCMHPRFVVVNYETGAVSGAIPQSIRGGLTSKSCEFYEKKEHKPWYVPFIGFMK